MTKLFDRRDLVIRHVLIASLSMLFALSESEGIMAKPPLDLFGEDYWRMFLWHFLYISTIWNGNIALIEFSPYNKWNWETQAKRKILLTVFIATAWPILINYFFNIIFYPIILHRSCNLGAKETIVLLILSVSITLFINAVFVALEFFNHWRKSVTEREALKRTTITAEFESLKSQVNPHFLFNALNTLSSLIEDEPKVATEFVQQLASVYRYLLSQNEKEIVSLGEELDFMKSYVFLNQIRFGENLKVTVNVDPKFLHKNIITLTLQILLENAIKHNVISAESPLHINIEAKEDSLCVCNNLQPKLQLATSNGIGLSNIKSRYHFFNDKEVVITKTAEKFEVCVPLI